jgi:hypothetical protein
LNLVQRFEHLAANIGRIFVLFLFIYLSDHLQILPLLEDLLELDLAAYVLHLCFDAETFDALPSLGLLSRGLLFEVDLFIVRAVVVAGIIIIGKLDQHLLLSSNAFLLRHLLASLRLIRVRAFIALSVRWILLRIHCLRWQQFDAFDAATLATAIVQRRRFLNCASDVHGIIFLGDVVE